MKQAAMYVRVSTSQQKEEATIESQKAVLSAFAKSKGFEIPTKLIFEDNGVSGSNLIRPALDNLRDYASENLFDHVFVLSPDRLSRKYAYQALLLEEFKRNNVTIIFRNSPTQNTPEEVMLVQMQGMFAEYERAQITERTRRGKKHKAKNGSVSVLTRAPYGYRYIRDLIGNQANFEINDKEASVVRAIFDLYTKNRLSIRQIKDYLENQKIFTSKGKENWSISSISNILRQSSYRGIAYYGKTEKCEPNAMILAKRQVRMKPRTRSSKACRLKNRSEWIAIPVPSIVSNETFSLAQELLKKNINLSPRNTKEGSLLQGIISCKECGYAFKSERSGEKAKGYSYYRCGEKNRKCSNRGIRIKDLDTVVWKALLEILESPELIKEEISRRVSELKNEPHQLKKKQFEKKMVKIETESNRLLDAFQEGCIEKEELKIRMNDLKREKNDTLRQIAGINEGLSQEQLLEINLAVEYFSKHLKEIQNNLSLLEKRKVLRMLIKEIQIGKDAIEINHIIPLEQWGSNQIACLRPCRVKNEKDLKR